MLLSLVNIEILFNIGDYKGCVELAEELLSVLKPNIIEKIKPANFSTNLFVNHLMDTFKIVGFAKLLLNDSKLEEYFSTVKESLGAELSDIDCIIAIKEFLGGKKFAPSNIELSTPFAKVIFLILQEISVLNDNYKKFAQNIYQAKLLAADLHQTQIEYICDTLIGYSYAQMNIAVKADCILNDVLKKAETSAIFNVFAIAKYCIVKAKIKNREYDDALLIVNDMLAELQKTNNQAQVFYAMFERLFIDILELKQIKTIDIDTELQKLLLVSPHQELERIVRSHEFTARLHVKEMNSKKQNFIEDKLETKHAPTKEPTQPKEDDDLAEMAENSSDSDSMRTETHK